MVRFGEARSWGDLVWSGAAGEARRGQVRFGLSGSGQARHDVVGQVWCVSALCCVVSWGLASFGPERQVWRVT